MNQSITRALPGAAFGAFVIRTNTGQAEDIKIDRSNRAFKEAQASLTRSTEVYKTISEGKMGKVPQSVLDSTRCVVVFPDTMTISAGLGKTHGDGVGFCKSAAGTWQNPMFLTLIGGSLGLQAGVTSARLVLYITGDKAAEALKQGTFTLDGELRAVAGTFYETVAASHADLVAYQRTEKLFADASVEGINISRDESHERAFYEGAQGNEKPLPIRFSRVLDHETGLERCDNRGKPGHLHRL